MEFVELPSTSAADLLSWFGWKRVQTAYNYLEIGGRRIQKMSAAMVEKYTGKKVEASPEEVEVEEELKEEPVVQPKPSPLKTEQKEKDLFQLFKEVTE